jgi:hypothetical protein
MYRKISSVIKSKLFIDVSTKIIARLKNKNNKKNKIIITEEKIIFSTSPPLQKLKVLQVGKQSI